MAQNIKRPGSWVGVDLDGTLAEYHGYISHEHIGKPIPLMVARVKKMRAEGITVKIMTARIDGGETAIAMGYAEGEHFRDTARIEALIQDWTEIHIGERLPVTCKKDFGMVMLFDDRAVQVVPNTGERVDGLP